MRAISRVGEGAQLRESGKGGDQFGRKNGEWRFTLAQGACEVQICDNVHTESPQCLSTSAVARRALAGILLFLAFTAAAQEGERREGAARLMDELMLGKDVGGDFTLTDARGRKRSLHDFRGKVVVLYFGFTTCPDICPTDMLAIGRAVKDLGKDGRAIQPLFVTLDPARDKPAVIAEYARNFHPDFVALTGSEAEIAKVARAYKVFYEKVEVEGGAGYTIDHSSFAFVIDRQGKYVGFIPPGTPRDKIARILHAEVRSAP
jgi:protein SCO1/2